MRVGRAARARRERDQQNGCGALWELAVNAENRVAIAAAGGVEAVVAAMRAHAADAMVQQNGCGALASLAANSAENKVAIAAAGGVEAVKAAMRAHSGDTAVQQWVNDTLRELA